MSKRPEDPLKEVSELATIPQWEIPQDRESVIRYCKALFMSGANYTALVNATGLPFAEFDRHEKEWRAERKGLDEKIIEYIRHKKLKDRGDALIGLGANIIERELLRFAKQEAALKASELKTISDVISNIHRITRLEKGLATNINSETKEPNGAIDVTSLAEFSDILPKSITEIRELTKPKGET